MITNSEKKQAIKIDCPYEMGIQNANFVGIIDDGEAVYEHYECECNRVDCETRLCTIYKKGGE